MRTPASARLWTREGEQRAVEVVRHDDSVEAPWQEQRSRRRPRLQIGLDDLEPGVGGKVREPRHVPIRRHHVEPFAEQVSDMTPRSAGKVQHPPARRDERRMPDDPRRRSFRAVAAHDLRRRYGESPATLSPSPPPIQTPIRHRALRGGRGGFAYCRSLLPARDIRTLTAPYAPSHHSAQPVCTIIELEMFNFDI